MIMVRPIGFVNAGGDRSDCPRADLPPVNPRDRHDAACRRCDEHLVGRGELLHRQGAGARTDAELRAYVDDGLPGDPEENTRWRRDNLSATDGEYVEPGTFGDFSKFIDEHHIFGAAVIALIEGFHE